MTYTMAGFICLGGIFLLIYGALAAGRAYAVWQAKVTHGEKQPDIHVAEGAIFALLGLIIALTFNSAVGKFDGRRGLIIEEANSISNAWSRLDLLPQEIRGELRNEFYIYFDSRLKLYDQLSETKVFSDKDALRDTIAESRAIQATIWSQAVNACDNTSSTVACMLLLPELNNMFDLANTRIKSVRLHPPVFVFFLLIGLATLSSILAGYSMSVRGRGGWLHSLSFAIVIAVTIYAIIDMEYPRIGLIQVTHFDEALLGLRANLAQFGG